jgi:hypothetical protein
MDRWAAETLALKALAFLATDADALMRFLTQTGLDLDDLKLRAGDAELLAGVLDFLLGEDALVTAFAAEEGVDPTFIHAARRALPGAGFD